MIFNLLSNASANYDKLAYEFSFENIDGGLIKLKNFEKKVIVIINVASKCGFTNQYEDMQDLWTNYKNKDLIVIGVPTNNFRQEPGTNSEIKDFCNTNFGINFPMTEKVSVKGDKAHPFYIWAKNNHGKSAVPKWNFHKIIVNKNGKIAETYSSITNPTSKKFIKLIDDLL